MKRAKSFTNWPRRIRFTYKRRFHAVFEQHRERHGQPFTVIRAILRPERGVEAEVGPMVRIRFLDGTCITAAWPEEVVATINGERLRVRA